MIKTVARKILPITTIALLLILQILYRDIISSIAILIAIITIVYIFRMQMVKTYISIIAIFIAIYTTITIILQILALNTVDIYGIAMISINILTISLGMMTIITILYRHIAKTFICREKLRLLLIALKALEGLPQVLKEAIAINKINYRSRKSLRNIFVFYTRIIMMININVLNNLIQYYESLVTMIPSAMKCHKRYTM
ncbi:hypothetical protein Igag_0966 [Ignisphaera aggregans DSM 17230]|uniref:Uncharacterized protein n=1 Tax=Ignisphaera aggregans (strain DSM 17230 / JCM 13409 / AQ1.S1) TaxID=583356 RepID=E0SNI5_IGNAA|nr:hypothetical protein Igag_0966 [Ignisphaera aggregans DSM 17230]